MTCTDTDIQELLPAFREHALDAAETKRVEDHLPLCAECRAELALLGMLKDDAVPDPGGAYWSSMPDRVFRLVQEERSRKQAPLSGWKRIVPAVPRWAWASAAAVFVAVLAWFVFQPASAVKGPANGSDQAALEDAAGDEPVDVAELTAPELTAVTQWADNAYAPIGEAVDDEDLADRTTEDIADDLRDLDARELDRLMSILKKKEREAREKTRASGQEKGIG